MLDSGLFWRLPQYHYGGDQCSLALRRAEFAIVHIAVGNALPTHLLTDLSRDECV
ncbi:Uncharacterised protein [Yersinia enterocolitica]|nr:Uncharacterised protein [Yersinia enterocolitica]